MVQRDGASHRPARFNSLGLPLLLRLYRLIGEHASSFVPGNTEQPSVLRALQRALGEHDLVTAFSSAGAIDVFESGRRFDIAFCGLTMASCPNTPTRACRVIPDFYTRPSSAPNSGPRVFRNVSMA